MKFTINSTVLNKALKEVLPAVSTNAIMPILENVKVSVGNDTCLITASNLNLTISTSAVCTADEKFEAVLPFKKLLNISSSVLGNPLTIAVGKNIQVDCLGKVWELGKPDDVSTFPKAEAFEETLSIDADEELLYYLKLAVNCVGKDRDDYIWHDVFFEVGNGEVTIVATDRMQLFKYSQKVNSRKTFKGAIEPNFIRAINSVKSATLSGNETFFKLQSDSITIVGRLTENKSPNYQLFFPEYSHNCKVNRRELLSELNSVMVYESTWHGCLFTFQKDAIKMNYVNIDTEEKYSGEIAAEHEVDFEKIFFNCGMVKNLLALMPETESVSMYFQGETQPVHIDDPESNLKLLLIPLVNQVN